MSAPEIIRIFCILLNSSNARGPSYENMSTILQLKTKQRNLLFLIGLLLYLSIQEAALGAKLWTETNFSQSVREKLFPLNCPQSHRCLLNYKQLNVHSQMLLAKRIREVCYMVAQKQDCVGTRTSSASWQQRVSAWQTLPTGFISLWQQTQSSDWLGLLMVTLQKRCLQEVFRRLSPFAGDRLTGLRSKGNSLSLRMHSY